jgi:hypothetical protein
MENKDYKKLWELLGEIPQAEPSDNMVEKFNQTLRDFENKKVQKGTFYRTFIRKISGLLPFPAIPRLAFTLFILAAGAGIGYFLHPKLSGPTAYNSEIDSLSAQVSDLKQLMVLSLLQDQSASMRLQAVSYTEELKTVDQKVIEALLMTLNSDPNVNVRLATLEALAKLAPEPSVREGLVRSIENQDSPIVQSAIADIMVSLNEKSSVEPLKKLLSRKDLNQAIKNNIEQSIQKLI